MMFKKPTQLMTPNGLGLVTLREDVRDKAGDPVMTVHMAMDRETAEGLYAAAISDCAEAHRYLLDMLADLALGALQAQLSVEIERMTKT